MSTLTATRITYLVRLTIIGINPDGVYVIAMRVSCSSRSSLRITLGNKGFELFRGSMDGCKSFACGVFNRNIVWLPVEHGPGDYETEFEVESYL